MAPERGDSDRFNYFYIDIFLDGLPPADWTYEWQNYISTGDATEVNLALDRLIQAIIVFAGIPDLLTRAFTKLPYRSFAQSHLEK